MARLQTQRHGRNSGGSAAHTGGAKPEETYHKGTWYILYILPFTDFKAGYFWLECKLNPLSSGYKMTTFNVRGNETEKCRAETMEMQMCVLSVVTDGSYPNFSYVPFILNHKHLEFPPRDSVSAIKREEQH